MPGNARVRLRLPSSKNHRAPTYDKSRPNDEAALRAVFGRLAEHGRVLIVVDQPASIGALAVAVAREPGVAVAYLPGLAMRRIADLHPAGTSTPNRALRQKPS